MKGLVFLMGFLCLVSVELSAKEPGEQKYSEVTIPGTEVRKYKSENLDHDYNLLVSLPAGYSESTKSYPVVYLLDAQWDFPLVSAIYGELFYDGAVPGFILVGITWGGENPDYDSLRAGSFTPTHNDEIPNSGKAEKFLKLIQDEIIPFVDSNYRTDKTDRTLMGSSFGGVFTLYTLFSKPQLFNRYVLTSPAIAWDNYSIYKYEEACAEKYKSLQARLYMTVGGYEDVDAFQKFAEVLKGRKYDGLTTESTVLEKTGHSGGKAEGYSRGLRFAFEKTDIKLDEAVLEGYIGTYEIAPDSKVELIVEDGYLTAVFPDGEKVYFHADGKDEFYRPGYYAFLKFKKDDSGKVTGVQLDQYGSSSFAKKID